MSLTIEVREEEALESALKRFKRKCLKEGIFQDIKNNSYYDKPSVRKRKKHQRALRRLKRKKNQRSFR